MGLIFFLSAQPDLSTGLGTWDLILRKLAHMAEYGLLWLLWWRALGYGNPALPAAIAIGYSITDESRWTHVIPVGNVTDYTLKGMAPDNFMFGVRAIDKDGYRSPVSYPVPASR